MTHGESGDVGSLLGGSEKVWFLIRGPVVLLLGTRIAGVAEAFLLNFVGFLSYL